MNNTQPALPETNNFTYATGEVINPNCCPQCGYYASLIRQFPICSRFESVQAYEGFALLVPAGVQGTLMRINHPHLWVSSNTLVIKWDDHESQTSCAPTRESWVTPTWIPKHLKLVAPTASPEQPIQAGGDGS